MHDNKKGWKLGRYLWQYLSWIVSTTSCDCLLCNFFDRTFFPRLDVEARCVFFLYYHIFSCCFFFFSAARDSLFFLVVRILLTSRRHVVSTRQASQQREKEERSKMSDYFWTMSSCRRHRGRYGKERWRFLWVMKGDEGRKRREKGKNDDDECTRNLLHDPRRFSA